MHPNLHPWRSRMAARMDDQEPVPGRRVLPPWPAMPEPSPTHLRETRGSRAARAACTLLPDAPLRGEPRAVHVRPTRPRAKQPSYLLSIDYYAEHRASAEASTARRGHREVPPFARKLQSGPCCFPALALTPHRSRLMHTSAAAGPFCKHWNGAFQCSPSGRSLISTRWSCGPWHDAQLAHHG